MCVPPKRYVNVMVLPTEQSRESVPLTFVASFHDAFDRVSAFFALSSSGTCDAASALVELWCCLASVAAVSAYRPTRSLPAARGACRRRGGSEQAHSSPSVKAETHRSGRRRQSGCNRLARCGSRRRSWARSAVCDGRHSAHDVLHYASESIAGPPLLLQMGGQVVLETCWWVPVAFGGAGSYWARLFNQEDSLSN